LYFTKLQAHGNDFLIVVVDDVDRLANPGRLAFMICDRHHGAGADGVVFVSRSMEESFDFASRIFNADGGEAEVSGNGTRCVAAFLHHAEFWTAPEVRIRTAVGVKQGRLVARSGLTFSFEFEMGRPRLASSEMPMALDPPVDRVVGHDLAVSTQTLKVTCVSMGNPHCSFFTPSLSDTVIDEIGPLIETHALFPNRTNVEMIRVISADDIEVLFWERGVGRTLSSGTGSCAAAVASALNGFTGRRVHVNTPGGPLTVDWGSDEVVRLTGSADVVYEGKWLGDRG
jgi:diaminopimelate epimerase